MFLLPIEVVNYFEPPMLHMATNCSIPRSATMAKNDSVSALIPGVNCTGKYTAINQRQFWVGSGPMDVQFASGGYCSFGKEVTDCVICSVIFSLEHNSIPHTLNN